MRDLALMAFLVAVVPLTLKRPYVGLLAWVWFSLMNPHRLTYGFAYSFQFAMIIAVVTLFSLLVNLKKLYPFPLNGVTASMLLFVLWINVSPLFSFHPEGEAEPWLRAIKVQVMVLVTFYVVGSRRELHLLAWVLALSIGFFGLKGGVFTTLTGGEWKVFGPEGSFIEDNNALALAIIMAVPLFRYLQLQSSNRWVRAGCVLMMLFCVASAVGSYSRGALLALGAMGVFLWFKSRNKAVLGIVAVVVGVVIFAVMPDSWSNRMNSIGAYEEDQSAQGRINAWWMAWNLALSRVLIGGGFDIYNADLFARFSPHPDDIHAAHSIYFQVLGEHGFIGLFIFLAVFSAAWRCGSWVLANAKRRPELRWASDMAGMLQVSLIGYATGGAFLSLTYYDFPYYVASMLAIIRVIVKRELDAVPKTARHVNGVSPGAAPGGLGLKR